MEKEHYDQKSFKQITYKGKEYYFKPDLYLESWFFVEYYIKKTRKFLFVVEYEYYKKIWRSKHDYPISKFDNLTQIRNIINDELKYYFDGVTDVNKFGTWDGNLTPNFEELLEENQKLKKQLGLGAELPEEDKSFNKNVSSNAEFVKNMEE